MANTVLAFGETLWDLLPSGAQLGGAPFNFCYRVNSLGETGLMVTRLGTDELGERAYAKIVELEMDTRFVQWDDEAPTGTVQVDLSDPNNPDFYIVPNVAYDNIRPSQELLGAAAGADCVCFGTLIQRTAASRRTLQQVLEAAQDAVKLCDINLRKDCYSRETVVESLRGADILKLNDDEACELAGMFGVPAPRFAGFCEEMISRWRLTHVVVTLGERGAFVAAAAGARAYVPGYRVDLVDTCGSGDAFTAGFIHRLMRGRPPAECCELGNALGAMVATQDGATFAIPPASVDAFLRREHERIEEPSLAAR